MEKNIKDLSFKAYLTMQEASILFGIGIHRIRGIAYSEEVPILKAGKKTLLQNKGLSEYLDQIAKTGHEI